MRLIDSLYNRIVLAAPREWNWRVMTVGLPFICIDKGSKLVRLFDEQVALTLLDDMRNEVLSIYPDGDGWCVGIPHSRFIGENLPIAIAKAWLSLREERCPKCRKLLRECPNCSVGRDE